MHKKNFKRLVSLLVVTAFFCSSCGAKKQSYRNYSGLDPRTIETVDPEKVEIDFIQVHNEVLDNIMSQYTPFFFVMEDGFTINGTNDPKKININVTCITGTTATDLDLFLSMALNYIGLACSEQNDKYKAPTFDKEDGNVYTDFGTVFNDYDLEIDAKDEDGNQIVKYDVKAGEKIPVNPRYISEE